jgi:hypothetical protein
MHIDVLTLLAARAVTPIDLGAQPFIDLARCG